MGDKLILEHSVSCYKVYAQTYLDDSIKEIKNVKKAVIDKLSNFNSYISN